MDEKPLPDVLLEQRERSVLLNEALSSLSENERTALVLYYIREHTQKEMADFLGVSSTTVKKCLHDGFSDLQQQESVAALSAALDVDKLAIGHIKGALEGIGDCEIPENISPALDGA